MTRPWIHCVTFSVCALPFWTSASAVGQDSRPTAATSRATSAPKAVNFPSLDGLSIRGDLYAPHQDPTTPFILLCHQAGWSRGEYLAIAPQLNAMGFNCLAIDQRSGKGVGSVDNETHQRATAERKRTNYVDARQDIVAALHYARANLAKGKLLAWGSSYSSALVLQIAGTETQQGNKKPIADGVLSFAPGEYFQRLGKSDHYIQDGAKQIHVPTFITSAKKEHPQWKAIYAAIPGDTKSSFLPKTEGNHGSRALWAQFEDHEDYWVAVRSFLDAHFPRGVDTSASRPTKK